MKSLSVGRDLLKDIRRRGDLIQFFLSGCEIREVFRVAWKGAFVRSGLADRHICVLDSLRGLGRNAHMQWGCSSITTGRRA